METRRTIHDLLADARRGLRRLAPSEAAEAMRRGALVIDTRSEDQRREQGVIPGSRHHPLSALEWTLDPASEHSDPAVALDAWLVLVCAEGYSSSLAAARLQALGFSRATDMVGGVAGWAAAGLPLEPA